ncbi:MAG: DUF1697 domain-containing protein [Planctomycetota bacterium]
MPSQYVALIRGINVGKARRVAMADLRGMLEDLGYESPRTILNSGNVVFDAPKGMPKPAAKLLEGEMEERLGVAAAYTVLSEKELGTILEENPLLDVADNHSRLMVSVPARKADLSKLKPLEKKSWKPEAIRLGRRAAYVWAPGGILESEVMKAVADVLGDALTSRNWATMLKIAAKL